MAQTFPLDTASQDPVVLAHDGVHEASLQTRPALYTAMFSQGRNQNVVWQGTWEELYAKNNLMVADKNVTWSLSSVNCVQNGWNQRVTYTAIWTRSLQTQRFFNWFGSWDKFIAQVETNKSTMRVLDLAIHPAWGERIYVATWGGSPNKQRFVHNVNWADFQTQWAALSKENWRLTKIQAYPAQAQSTWHVTGMFEMGVGDPWDKFPGQYDLICTTKWDEFNDKHRKLEQQGRPGSFMRLRDFQVYDYYPAGQRYYFGVWQETSFPCKALFALDYATLKREIDLLTFSESREICRITPYAKNMLAVAPRLKQSFDDTFANCPGYCGWYWRSNWSAVFLNGMALAKQDWPANPVSPKGGPEWTPKWTTQTRMNLASVSKPITAVAVLKLLYDKRKATGDSKYQVDSTFYQFIREDLRKVGDGVEKIGNGVDKVTIRDLLGHKSGLEPESHLSFDNIWTFLKEYLQKDCDESQRGKDSKYHNTNFTILQAVVDSITGHGGQNPDYYETYVQKNLMERLGIDTKVFSATPDEPPSQRIHYYNNKNDPESGVTTQGGGMRGVAAGGWIASVSELSKFLMMVRNGQYLDKETTELMFENNLGWATAESVYGQYFFHNGGFQIGGTETHKLGLSSIICLFPTGGGAVLLVNTEGQDVLGAVIRGWEAQIDSIPKPTL